MLSHWLMVPNDQLDVEGVDLMNPVRPAGIPWSAR